MRSLDRDGLVRRTATATMPMRVEYELTPLGREFLHLQRGVKAWADVRVGDIVAARDHYDASG